MRLIDADALHSTLADWQLMLSETYGTNDEFVRCLEDVLCTVDNTPTIAASPWHRVEDVLPDDTRDVLAVRRYGNDLEKQEVIVAHLSVIMDMKRGFDKWWNATNITHWMPFPEPPKEDA